MFKRLLCLICILSMLQTATVFAETFQFGSTLNASTTKTADLYKFTEPQPINNLTVGDYSSSQPLCTAGSTERYTLQYRYGLNGTWSTRIPTMADLGIPYCGQSTTCEYRLLDTATNTVKYSSITGGWLECSYTMPDDYWYCDYAYDCPDSSCGAVTDVRVTEFFGTSQCEYCGSWHDKLPVTRQEAVAYFEAHRADHKATSSLKCQSCKRPLTNIIPAVGVVNWYDSGQW